MPHRYSRERNLPGAYHVFNQGLGGMAVFRDDEDRQTFAWMIDRHLTSSPGHDLRGREFVNLRDKVRLNARNLMTTHFHLILWQRVPGGLDQLMRRVGPAYTRYFHRKYGGEGPIFRERYRARRLDDPQTFKWRIYYVHSNHSRLGLEWPHSTHRFYLEPDDAASSLDVESALKVFGGVPQYVEYLAQCAERSSLDARLRLELPGR